MFKDLTRRDFIKATSMTALAMTVPINVFAADNCTVKTRYGTFNGFVDKQGVKTWLGIPYAQPPVKNLRWQAPQPLKSSDKTFDAKKFGFTAMQSVDERETASIRPQSEDCLTLNIWRRSEKKNLPVMVFIPGGGFQTGGSSDIRYHGSNFAAANDVVLVTINYRLNVFGFLNLASIDSAFEDSGYLGIKDQVAALKWVKENIAAFGGNPDNITIFGQSAGSTSVMLLTITPAAKNLFQKAIPQSGHLGLYNTPEESAKVAEIFMEMSGAKTIGDLMKKSSAELINIYEKVNSLNLDTSLLNYMPTCDGKFIPGDPFKALKDGGAREIKFLTGTTSDEWCFWLSYTGYKFFETLRANSRFVLAKYNGTATPEEIYRKWLENRPDTEENYINFVNNADWRVGQEVAAEYQSKFNDVYYYLFTESADDKLRSYHGIDLVYTFNLPDKNFNPNPAPNLVKQVQTSWAAFAATGNPNNEFIPHWEKYSVNNRQTMELNSKGCVCHKDLNTDNLNSLRYVYEN
ncbi:MAG: carboxylesterase family protein [Selenomonadaceae bacterium]|nr:carboxylesterase family protein [Selenomonadaceae bacterium]